MSTEGGLFLFAVIGYFIYEGVQYYQSLSTLGEFSFWLVLALFAGAIYQIYKSFFSKEARERKTRLKRILELPHNLLVPSKDSVKMGLDLDLQVPILLPDSIRSRHVHIIGATGSGKTESVILNFLRQDVERGLGGIILDAKGDASFLREISAWVPKERLRVFDLSSDESLTYNPIEVGTPLEAAQRLFSSLTWSEEYYKSKALSALQRLFERRAERKETNPRLIDLANNLEDPDSYIAATISDAYPKKLAEKDFMELSGLRDQIRSLCIGHLPKILSPSAPSQMNLEEAANGVVLYFRLQSLLSPQIVSTLGRLLINHLSYLAGIAHREVSAKDKKRILVPVYLDEFASFACTEFADLISKSRSAGFALHFSHQSIGDVVAVSEGFLSQITDNSATKIVLRINDPDSAEFFSRSFGTKLYQKITQRITNAEELHRAEVTSEGSQREAHQFRANPDLLKTLPTGVGSVLIAHGEDTAEGASSVFKIRFPRLEEAMPLSS